MFKRRIGPIPNSTSGSSGANGCPDIWELENGDFAIIGFQASAEIISTLPESASIEGDEAMIVVPRAVVLGARKNLNELEFVV